MTDENTKEINDEKEMLEDETLQHVQEVIAQARQKIQQLHEELLARIDRVYRVKLSTVCKRHNCSMITTLDKGGCNPFDIQPLLYVWFNSTPAGELMNAWRPLLRELSFISDIPITIKLLDSPYEKTGKHQYQYPTSTKAKEVK